MLGLLSLRSGVLQCVVLVVSTSWLVWSQATRTVLVVAAIARRSSSCLRFIVTKLPTAIGLLVTVNSISYSTRLKLDFSLQLSIASHRSLVPVSQVEAV